ncbi:MAG: c-type cytochrome [Sedimenticola sp.]
MRVPLSGVTALLLLAGCTQQNSDGMLPGRWYSQAQVEQGEQVFLKNCAVCHGAKAQGLADDWRQSLPDGSYPPPPLNGTAHAWHHPLKMLKRTVDKGGIPLGGKMPPFKAVLDESEKYAAIAYFQNFWNDEIYDAWKQRGGLN